MCSAGKHASPCAGKTCKLCYAQESMQAPAREKLVSSVMRGKIKRCREAWENAFIFMAVSFFILTRKVKLKNVSRRFDVSNIINKTENCYKVTQILKEFKSE